MPRDDEGHGASRVTGNSDTRARAYDEIPSLLDMIGSALEIRDMALQKTNIGRDGSEQLSPELNSATKALELACRLCGYLGEQMTPEQYRAALKKAGWELTRKDGLKAVK